MQIVDHSQKRLGTGDVPIVSPTRLPEETLGALAALSGQTREPLGRIRLDVSDRLAANGLLDRLQYSSYGVRFATRIHDEMNMIGHEDIGPEREVLALAGHPNRFGQPLTTSIGSEEGMPLVGRERQLVRVASDIE